MSSLLVLARRHCLAVRPAVCIKPFVKDTYGVRYDFVYQCARGRRRPSPKLIAAIRATHARLFPTEPLPEFPEPPKNPQLN